MKELQYVLCNIPFYFNENDIKNIQNNYKTFIFPKKKLIFKFVKHNTFCDFLLSLNNIISNLDFSSKYSQNVLLIDGRILFTSKIKDINCNDNKIFNLSLHNTSLNLKKKVYYECDINENLPFYLYSFIYINKKYINFVLLEINNEIKKYNSFVNYYDDIILLNYFHKNINKINEIHINYRIVDYDFFTMTTFGRMGRLGNQIFQWMFLNALCKKHNRILKIPFTFNHIHDKFSIHLNKLFNVKINYLSSLDFYKPIYMYKETKFNYNEILENINFDKYNNYDFYGYYQSEKYFKNININDCLKIHDGINDECKKNIERYKNYNKDSTLISLHIRRGDLVQAKQYGPSISNKYIQESINYMRQNYNKIVWLIFSDDIDWCQKTLKMKEAKYYPDGNLVEDFIMMSLCEHHIISNSTFSWWAAYLNNNTSKKIICPSEWFYDNFLPKGEDDTDLVPSSWIRF